MNKIYVGNLPQQTTEESLRAIFADHGEIKGIQLIKDRYTGELRGFGFIEYATQAQAQAALVLNGQQYQGKTLKVSIAQERRATGGGGGGGGGDRRGGGGGFGGGGGGGERRRW